MQGDVNRHHEHELSQDRQDQREAAARRIVEGERPWDEEQGVLSVVDAVRDIQFPADRAAIKEQAGSREVHPSSRLTLPVADVLEKLPDRRFESIRDFQTSLQKHWQGIRVLELPREQRSPEGGPRPAQKEARATGEAQGRTQAQGRDRP